MSKQPADGQPPSPPLREPAGLQTAWTRNFADLSFEWRRLFGEAFGTFLLVLAAAGGAVVDAVSHGQVPAAAQAVAPGLLVMAVIYFVGTVSGAHLNPAVTCSFALRGNFPWRRVPGYVAAQLLGSVAATAFLWSTFGDVAHLGATVPTPRLSAGAALGLELVLTVGLISVILGTATGGRNIGANAAIAIGGYIALAGLWAGPATGASMNPARSLGPALLADCWRDWWVYLVGPLAGGVVAVAFAWVLRGPPSSYASEVAQGRGSAESA